MSREAPYLAVADALRARILAGEWRLGGRLPSRARLAVEYGVGRNVVQRAVDRLIAEGLLEGRAGSGTYVRAPRERLPMIRARRRGSPGHPATSVAERGRAGAWDFHTRVRVPAPAAIAWRLAATTAGSLLAGLPAGAWVDRVRKRPVLIGADLARAAVLLSVPAARWSGLLTVEWLYGTALAHGLLTVFFDVSYASYLPHLVGRARLMEANSTLSAARSATSIGGPALAGPLVGGCGPATTLLASAAGMTLSALLALAVRRREDRPARQDTRPRLRREVREGLRFVLAHPVLRATILGDAVFNLFLAMYQAMLLLFLERESGLGAAGAGLVLSGMGCGALLGALSVTGLVRRFGQGTVVWLAPLVTCPPTALIPLARTGVGLGVAAVGLAALSFGGVARVVAQTGFQQSLTPDGLLGRMNATARFVSWGVLPLGGLLGGAAGTAFGAPAALLVAAAGMTLGFLPAFLSPLRTAEREKSPACEPN
ncbi:MFS transporter [Streptomyces sp. AM6-12]|uniref:MFS transporter n=1 Tax=Streptomyces sp. AM6-12 TaxID=3345149 RepID=UPI0037AEF6A5